MVNTRGKIKKTNNTYKICFSQASTDDSNHQSTRSGALIASNDDLLIEILLRLPVTSILRFKSVSKHWLWLLSHRRFTLLYDKFSKSIGLFVRNMYIPYDVENRSKPPFRSLDFYFDPCGIRIVQACNGLLLCCSNLGNERARKYYVYNPTTKQFALIPSVPGGQNVRRTIRSMGLAFHQTDCVHYKVVCIRTVEPNGDLFQIQIYSSATGKWKISCESFSANDYKFNVFDVVRGEKEEDTFVVVRIPGKLIRYNVHDKSFKQISDISYYFYEGHTNVHRYTETLTSF